MWSMTTSFAWVGLRRRGDREIWTSQRWSLTGQQVVVGSLRTPVHDDDMSDEPEDARVDGFVREQRELWMRAQRIARRNPSLDIDGLFRTLKNLRRTPEERLRLGLRAGRMRRDG